MIRFQDVSKSFGENKVLNGLSFAASKGEKLALIGPSGSGKTTILRVLMTLEEIDQGLIEMDGECLWNVSAEGRKAKVQEKHLHHMRSKVGMVFQQFNLFPHMSVIENITIGPRLSQGVPLHKAEEAARELLEQVGLTEKSQARPGELSGGQKQRVAIARALALQPKILLFDEVTSALDPELVEEVQDVISRLAEETDITMLLVTHEMTFARDFAHRVLFFDAGQIVEEGPPDQIFSGPSEQRTKEFLRKVIAAGQRV